MRIRSRTALIFCAVLIGFAGASAAKALTLAEKAALQAVMQQHIEASLVDGRYLNLDLENGTVQKLYPVKAHPEILKMGEYYVLCSDFRDDEGQSINVDFYIARQRQTFVVFHRAVNDRNALAKLMSKGVVKRAN